MNTEKQAAEVLRQAEANLRELVSAAATAGDYASVVKIAAWARAVGDMVKEAPAVAAPAGAGIGAPVAVKNQTRSPKSAKASKPGRGPSVEYPRFLRQDDHLVRIAWSKREKKEYRHKATYAVLQALIKVMSELGKDGRVFATDDFLPIHDGDGNEVPSYQAYVGIALLKHTSLLEQHGRQGYSIPRLAEFADTVEALWQKIPSK